MVTTANITPTAPTDGVVYANAVPLVTTEADLNGGAGVATGPIPIIYGQTIVAVVKLSISGHITANSAFVFLQTDLGDGTWVDVAWCFYNQTDAPSTFVLCGGGIGAMNNAFQQARGSGAAPATQANGSNAVPLGGRVRFSGWARAAGGSSGTPGLNTNVLATITYRLQGPQ